MHPFPELVYIGYRSLHDAEAVASKLTWSNFQDFFSFTGNIRKSSNRSQEKQEPKPGREKAYTRRLAQGPLPKNAPGRLPLTGVDT